MDKQTSSIEKAEEQLLQLINTNDINWDDLMRRLLSDETLEDIAKALTQERAWRMAENIARRRFPQRTHGAVSGNDRRRPDGRGERYYTVAGRRDPRDDGKGVPPASSEAGRGIQANASKVHRGVGEHIER